MRSHVLFILICVIWGCSFLLMKKAQLSYGSMDVAFFRVLSGAAGLGLYLLARRAKWPFTRADAIALFMLALFGYAVPFWIQPFVITYTTSGFVGMLVAFVPLLTIVVSIPMLGIRPTRRQVLGVVGGLACMAAIFGDQLRFDAPAWVIVLGLATPLTYAVTNTYVRQRFHQAPPLMLTAVGMAVASVIIAPLAAVVDPINVNEYFLVATLCLAVLGIIGTGLATSLFYILIRDHGPLYASMVTYVIPCVSLLVGWLDGERVTPVQIVALVGILFMVSMVQRRQ